MNNQIGDFVIDRDRHRLLSGHSNGEVQVWDLFELKHVETLEGHTGWVGRLDLSSQSRQVVSAGSEGAVILWPLDASPRLAHPLAVSGKAEVATSVAYSLDGRWVAAGTGGGDLLLWDAEDIQRPAERLEKYVDRITSLAFTADGRLLVSASWDGTLTVWDIPATKCVSPAVQLSQGRNRCQPDGVRQCGAAASAPPIPGRVSASARWQELRHVECGRRVHQ